MHQTGGYLTIVIIKKNPTPTLLNKQRLKSHYCPVLAILKIHTCIIE